MPSADILKLQTSPLNVPDNAFWLSAEKPLEFSELKSLVEGASEETERIFANRYEDILQKRKEAENHIKHVGYAVGSYIDAGIVDFDKRMVELSELYREYDESDMDSDLASALADKSMLLGYELQTSTQKLMHDLGISGESLPTNLLHGRNKDLNELFVKYSHLFPSSWNRDASYRHKTIFLLKDTRIVFNKKNLTFKSVTNNSSFEQVNSKFSNPERFKIAYGKDGLFSYSSLNQATRDERDSPLDFYTKHEIVHEMTHMYEKRDPYLAYMTESFLDGRAMKDPKSGRRLVHPEFMTEDHAVLKDHFPNQLCGQIYLNHFDRSDIKRNEILARGTESTLLGANGSLVGLPAFSLETGEVTEVAPDIDYRNFVLGVLFGHKK